MVSLCAETRSPTEGTGQLATRSEIDPAKMPGMSLRRRAAAAVLSALILAALTGCPMEAEDADDDGEDYITLSISR